MDNLSLTTSEKLGSYVRNFTIFKFDCPSHTEYSLNCVARTGRKLAILSRPLQCLNILSFKYNCKS